MKKLLFILSLFISTAALAQVPLAGYVTTIGPADTYPVTLDSLQAGGYTTTYNYTTRNAITPARRKIGMMVQYSSNKDSTFTLVGGIANANWVYIGSGNFIKNTTTPQTADFNITGSGYVGGAFTAETASNFILLGDHSSNSAILDIAPPAQTVVGRASNGTVSGRLTLNPNQVYIGIENDANGTNQGINFSPYGPPFVNDRFFSKGLINSGDYEANFTARSLITKRYADSLHTTAVLKAGDTMTGQLNLPTIKVGTHALNPGAGSGAFNDIGLTSATTDRSTQIFYIDSASVSKPRWAWSRETQSNGYDLRLLRYGASGLSSDYTSALEYSYLTGSAKFKAPIFNTNTNTGALTDSGVVKKSSGEFARIAPMSTILGSYVPYSLASGPVNLNAQNLTNVGNLAISGTGIFGSGSTGVIPHPYKFTEANTSSVAGVISIQNLSTNGYSAITGYDNLGNYKYSTGHSNASNFAYFDFAGDKFQIGNSGSEKFRVAPTFLFSTVPLGINTTTPLANIHVNTNNITTNGALFIGDNTNTGSLISFQGRAWVGYDSNNNAIFSSGSAKTLSLNVNGATAAASTTALFITSAGLIGIGGQSSTLPPTHTLTFGSTSTGIANYLTVDQTTNFERVRTFWNSNVYTILTEAGGSGTPRTIAIGGTNKLTIDNNANLTTAGVSNFFGSGATSGVIGVGGTVSTIATSSTIGRIFNVAAGTITRSADAGTIAHSVTSSIGIPTLAAGAASTYTNASTLYVAGAPVASTNVTITNPYSLYVNGGNSFFGGSVTATSFSGAGTGLTGTASALNIGGNAATVTNGVYTNVSNTLTGATPLLISSSSTGTAPFRSINSNASGSAATFGGGDATHAVIDIRSAAGAGAALIYGDGSAIFNAPVKAGGYTVATLPTGVVGQMTYVTDALAPSYLVTIVGGGSIVTPVFYNGTTWVAH